MGLAKNTAFFGAFLVVFDNSLLTQSKFLLMDIFLIFFGFLSIYLFLKYKKLNQRNDDRSYILLAFSLIFATFAFSVKWTGLLFLGIISLAILADFLKKFCRYARSRETGKFKTAFLKILMLIFIPLLTYYSVILLHLGILYKSGTGNAFMSSAFQKTLSGNNIGENVTPSSDIEKFIELNKTIYASQATTTGTHPDASKWYQWPLDKKPVWYWSKSDSQKSANIYFVGNPLIWVLILFGALFSFYALLNQKLRKKMPPFFGFLVLGYFANIISYTLIGRITFLYHYLPSLIFGILILCCLQEKIFSPAFKIAGKTRELIYWGFLALIVIAFFLLLPLSYGFPVSVRAGQIYNSFIKFLH